MPAKERLWRDEEAAPAPSRQQPGEGGEDRPIHRAVGDARIELALEDAHLVAEHHDLDVLVRLGPPRGSEQAEDPAQAEVTEDEGHTPSSGRWRRTLLAQGSDRGFGALHSAGEPTLRITMAPTDDRRRRGYRRPPGRVHGHNRLGGLIHEYEFVA